MPDAGGRQQGRRPPTLPTRPARRPTWPNQARRTAIKPQSQQQIYKQIDSKAKKDSIFDDQNPNQGPRRREETGRSGFGEDPERKEAPGSGSEVGERWRRSSAAGMDAMKDEEQRAQFEEKASRWLSSFTYG